MGEPAAKKAKLDGKKQAFLDVHGPLLDEIIADVEKLYPDYDKDALNWYRESMLYNCVGGKMNRGLSVLDSFRRLVAPREPTEAEIQDANELGWCIEWLQAFFLVSDDIMDDSPTRRGQPCWYKKKSPPCQGWAGEEVGMVAINDAFIIESAIYKLLKLHFRDKPYYVDILELLHETTYQTELGQMLDLITAPPFDVDVNKFTLAKYNCIVKYKTAFYSFYLPVAMAMFMAGITDKESHDNALEILLEMGEFFQVQDDYLDCYGTFEQIGKHGTDIQDNKCGWLIVQALARASPEQKKILEENYAPGHGEGSDEKVARVKAVYRELDLTSVFKAAEEESYTKLKGLISEKSGKLPEEIFTDFAEKIYYRTK